MQINARVEVNHEEILEQMLRENGVKEVASCMYNILWCMRDKLGTSKKSEKKFFKAIDVLIELS